MPAYDEGIRVNGSSIHISIKCHGDNGILRHIQSVLGRMRRDDRRIGHPAHLRRGLALVPRTVHCYYYEVVRGTVAQTGDNSGGAGSIYPRHGCAGSVEVGGAALVDDVVREVRLSVRVPG
ncbi:hypothetical protein ES703_04149 [subsurface metagenome]